MMLLMANFVVIGTWNTKGEELDFVCQELARRNHTPIRLDLSATKGSGDRNTALLSVVEAAKKKLNTLTKQQHISGAISVGGGTNLGMAIRVMTEMPLMIPKVIASTMIANSLTMLRTYKDIVYVQIPCDFGWLNPVSKAVLKNCVALVTSMDGAMPCLDRSAVAITNIGITSGYLPGAKAFWDEKGYELIPFHAVGESTMAMAELVDKGFFKGILDLTLHDILDHVAAGAYGKLDERRLYAYLSRDLPAVMAPGALDFIAYMSMDAVLPRAFAKRKVYRYDYRWCIRSSVKEVVKVARWIGSILDKTHPEHAVFLMPLGGWSGVGMRGGQYYGVELINAFREQMLKYWGPARVIDVDFPLEDPRFARLASQHLFGLMQKKWKM
ncbi:MAG TPA: Tm-1-like ATP-binding domain-containing protein [Syntrophorhabdales bacterium]|nr:Tm-1-like ATP-binding domain-containing protein [Syntrophorhabdales bacterium]